MKLKDARERFAKPQPRRKEFEYNPEIRCHKCREIYANHLKGYPRLCDNGSSFEPMTFGDYQTFKAICHEKGCKDGWRPLPIMKGDRTARIVSCANCNPRSRGVPGPVKTTWEIEGGTPMTAKCLGCGEQLSKHSFKHGDFDARGICPGGIGRFSPALPRCTRCGKFESEHNLTFKTVRGIPVPLCADGKAGVWDPS